MLKKVELKKLKPNPFRDLRIDPIDEAVVDMLAVSIKEYGFKSGGVVGGDRPDGLYTGSGHHRVAAGIKAGIKEAVVEVEKLDDDTQMRWPAQENATQRGQSSTAGQGSIIGALMVLAPRIMRGELDKLPPRYEPSHGSVRRSQKALEELQRKLTSDDGIGEPVICDSCMAAPASPAPRRATISPSSKGPEPMPARSARSPSALRTRGPQPTVRLSALRNRPSARPPLRNANANPMTRPSAPRQRKNIRKLLRPARRQPPARRLSPRLAKAVGLV